MIKLFWQEQPDKRSWKLLCEPAALLLTLNKGEKNGWFLKCLGETFVLPKYINLNEGIADADMTLDEAKQYAQHWLINYLSKMIPCLKEMF